MKNAEFSKKSADFSKNYIYRTTYQELLSCQISDLEHILIKK